MLTSNIKNMCIHRVGTYIIEKDVDQDLANTLSLKDWFLRFIVERYVEENIHQLG